jgi:TatD DNase family protein
VTYPRAVNLRESLKIVPFENLVLETDAPYLTPQIKRGKTNEPANVKYIYLFVSEIRNIEISKLCNIMEENFKKLYEGSDENKDII